MKLNVLSKEETLGTISVHILIHQLSQRTQCYYLEGSELDIIYAEFDCVGVYWW